MKNYQYFIGIDVSKNELDFALIESNKRGSPCCAFPFRS